MHLVVPSDDFAAAWREAHAEWGRAGRLSGVGGSLLDFRALKNRVQLTALTAVQCTRFCSLDPHTV
ncbi:hypothetical protein CH291_10490 [Rhodococcus sp. 14-1411-2a]|nr:hypothetical protein CH291_10490 [Rhodococcus sp. 14-1411-2a]